MIIEKCYKDEYEWFETTLEEAKTHIQDGGYMPMTEALNNMEHGDMIQTHFAWYRMKKEKESE